jgi:hypothetical protein
MGAKQANEVGGAVRHSPGGVCTAHVSGTIATDLLL